MCASQTHIILELVQLLLIFLNWLDIFFYWERKQQMKYLEERIPKKKESSVENQWTWKHTNVDFQGMDEIPMHHNTMPNGEEEIMSTKYGY